MVRLRAILRVLAGAQRAFKGELHAKVRKWRSELGKCRAGSGFEWICRQDRGFLCSINVSQKHR